MYTLIHYVNKETLKEEHRKYKFLEIIKCLNKKLVGAYAYYGMIKELYKIYYHTIYALRSSIFRRSQRRLSVETFNIILLRTLIIKPRIYKDIWCCNI